MNLELLFWAAANGGNPDHYDMAVKHAYRTRKEHIRPDGGSWHAVVFDQDDGTVIEKATHQGCRDDTTWSRGQSWGLYGFTVCYRFTNDPNLLQTAQRMADYMIAHLPADFIPPTDYDCTDGYKDSSAAAIACAGLLELNLYVKDIKYKQAAVNILSSLTGPAYLTDGTDLSSILKRGSQRYGEAERGLIYGDYYFLEAMLRYLKSPTCHPMIDTDEKLIADISGPAGIPDCRVDLYDLAALSVQWMECNDPFKCQ